MADQNRAVIYRGTRYVEGENVGYEEFDSGVAKNFVLDPHGLRGVAA